MMLNSTNCSFSLHLHYQQFISILIKLNGHTYCKYFIFKNILYLYKSNFDDADFKKKCVFI